MEDISDWPTDLAISVVPHEDSWKVEIMRDGPQRDADPCDMIGLNRGVSILRHFCCPVPGRGRPPKGGRRRLGKSL